MQTIGAIMRRHGSDKGGPHNYGPVYDTLFPDREKVTAVLELGVANGHSIRGWREAFPNAVIVGIDRERCPVPGERIEVHQGDQCSADCLLAVAKGRTFDLIVDDGSHRLSDQLFSLFILWPLLKPGGAYVIEEWDAYGGISSGRWSEHLALLVGAEWIDTVAMNGVHEPLIVVRK